MDRAPEDIVLAGFFHEFIGVLCELLTPHYLGNLVEFWYLVFLFELLHELFELILLLILTVDTIVIDINF